MAYSRLSTFPPVATSHDSYRFNGFCHCTRPPRGLLQPAVHEDEVCLPGPPLNTLERLEKSFSKALLTEAHAQRTITWVTRPIKIWPFSNTGEEPTKGGL